MKLSSSSILFRHHQRHGHQHAATKRKPVLIKRGADRHDYKSNWHLLLPTAQERVAKVLGNGFALVVGFPSDRQPVVDLIAAHVARPAGGGDFGHRGSPDKLAP